jgi:hypothetical protein
MIDIEVKTISLGSGVNLSIAAPKQPRREPVGVPFEGRQHGIRHGTLVNDWDRVSAWEGLLLMERSAASQL